MQMTIMATQRQRSHTTSDRLAIRAVTSSRGDMVAVSPVSPVARGKFRPVNFSTNVEFDQFFGQTAAQRRELHLHTRDEDGRWWFDEIERDECRGLLSPLSNSPAVSSRRGSNFNSAPCSPTVPYSASGTPFLGVPPRRRSSVCLTGSYKPLAPATPGASTNMGFAGLSSYSLVAAQGLEKGSSSAVMGLGIAGNDLAQGRRASEHLDSSARIHQQSTSAPTAATRTRAKRSYSATMRGNVIGQLPSRLQGSADPFSSDSDKPASGKDTGDQTNLIRLPAHLPLPHRLVPTQELEDAFRPQPLDPSSSATHSEEDDNARRPARKRRSIVFAPTTPPPTTQPSHLRNRRRPAHLDLSPHSSFTTLTGMQDNTKRHSLSSPDVSPLRPRSASRRPQSARGYAKPFLTTVGGGAAASPSSGLADAFSNALRGLKSPLSPHPFADSQQSPPGLRSARSGESSTSPEGGGYLQTPLDRDEAIGVGRQRRSLSIDLSTVRRRLSWSSKPPLVEPTPTSPSQQQQQQQYGSKSHAVLGWTPANSQLLVPGGLGTGEEVYDGVVIDCPSIRLTSDDEDEQGAGGQSVAKGKKMRKKAADWFKKSLVA